MSDTKSIGEQMIAIISEAVEQGIETYRKGVPRDSISANLGRDAAFRIRCLLLCQLQIGVDEFRVKASESLAIALEVAQQIKA